jgi:hypothetical protein
VDKRRLIMKKKKLKKIFNSTIGFLLNPAIWVANLSKTPQRFLMQNAAEKLSKRQYQVSYRIFPKNPDKEHSFVFDCPEKIAIVMQGPIRLEDHFTLNAVRFYKKNYPKSHLIVSTWKDEDIEEISAIEKEGGIVVLSEKPRTNGNLNVNLQLINSLAGIKKAQSLDSVFIAKTRTDQLLRRPNLFPFLIGLIKEFPPENTKQKGRLVVLSMNYGNLFFPFFMSDFFYFGFAEDIYSFFSQPLDGRAAFSMPVGASRKEYSESMYSPEVFMLTQYFKSLGVNCSVTIKNYWEVVRRYLICLDFQTVRLDWPKYSDNLNISSFYGEFFENDDNISQKTANFDFINWFNLYSGTLTYNPQYERYLSVPVTKK